MAAEKSETGNPFLDARVRRLQQIRKILIGLGEVEYKRAMNMIAFNFGISQVKAREHLNIVLDSDDSFTIFNNVIQFTGERKEVNAAKKPSGQKLDGLL